MIVKRAAGLVAGGFALLAGANVLVGWGLARPVSVVIGDPPADLHAQAIAFTSKADREVRGWWCPAPDASASILLLPGIRANRLSMVERARFLRRAGFSALLIDLQGTGETRGDRITFGWEERHDVLHAVEFLRRTQPGAKVGIIGSSLGGAAAVLAAPPLQVEAVVLEAVYPSLERATRNRLRKYAGPLELLLTPMLLSQLPARLGAPASDLRPVEHVKALTCPLLIVSGGADRHTTVGDTQTLFGAAVEPKELWIIPGAGHVDLHRFARAEYERRVGTFFEGALR